MITQKEAASPLIPQRQMAQLAVNYERCYYCGACVAVCLSDALFLNNMILTIDQTSCTRCERCLTTCPAHALLLNDLHFRANLRTGSSATADMLKNRS